MLQACDILRRPCVVLAAQTVLVDTAHIEHVLVNRIVAIGLRVAAHGFLGHFG